MMMNLRIHGNLRIHRNVQCNGQTRALSLLKTVIDVCPSTTWDQVFTVLLRTRITHRCQSLILKETVSQMQSTLENGLHIVFALVKNTDE